MLVMYSDNIKWITGYLALLHGYILPENLPRESHQFNELLRQAKLGEGGKPCRRIDMTETFYATQQVRALTGQGWPPAGIECCVVRG